jgi:hypothetical protein
LSLRSLASKPGTPSAVQPRVIAVPVASVAHRHGAQMRRTGSYERRDTEGGVLFKILQQHLDTFLFEANASAALWIRG